jgi:RNA polymerase sigma-70 factor (ECF subfamily)
MGKMSPPHWDSTFRLPLIESAEAARSPSSSHLEEEVIRLFEALREPMLRYLLAFGLTVADAEEITQEVFLSLFQHLRKGKGRQNLRGWVFRVAHNLALKQRQATRQQVQSRDEEGLVERQLDPSPNPEEQLAHSRRQKRLRAVLAALPEQDRYCLYLRAEGLRYREIAEVLGISLGGVSLSLGRSLSRLSRVDGG